MTASEEWIYWATEKQLNMNAHGGAYPAIKQSIIHERYTKLFYCYYTLKPGTYLQLMAPQMAGDCVVCLCTGQGQRRSSSDDLVVS